MVGTLFLVAAKSKHNRNQPKLFHNFWSCIDLVKIFLSSQWRFPATCPYVHLSTRACAWVAHLVF